MDTYGFGPLISSIHQFIGVGNNQVEEVESPCALEIREKLRHLIQGVDDGHASPADDRRLNCSRKNSDDDMDATALSALATTEQSPAQKAIKVSKHHRHLHPQGRQAHCEIGRLTILGSGAEL